MKFEYSKCLPEHFLSYVYNQIYKTSIMKKIFFVSFSLLLFVACSKKVTSTTSTASSGNDAAKAEAMYNSDVKALLENKCTPCHFPDKGGNKASLDSYASASKHIDEILERVQLK